jgi:polar amino acid transport system permease protein
MTDGSEPPAAASTGGAPTVAGAAAYVPSARQLERERVRRRATVRSTLIAAASTVVFGSVLVVLVTSAPGWPRVQRSFFSPEYAARSILPVLQGLWLNIRVMLVCEVCILTLGLLVAVLRTLRSPVAFPLRLLGAAYTDLFRGLPLILVILLLGLGVPGLRLEGMPDSVVFYGGAALVLTYSAYVAEVFRAGIESVHPSQRAAARSLGLTTAQTMRYVVLPQGVRRVVPPLLNDFTSLQKDSGLVSILGAIDAVRAAGIETAVSFNFTPYVVAGGLFVLLTIPMTRLTDWVAARATPRPGQGGVA